MQIQVKNVKIKIRFDRQFWKNSVFELESLLIVLSFRQPLAIRIAMHHDSHSAAFLARPEFSP